MGRAQSLALRPLAKLLPFLGRIAKARPVVQELQDTPGGRPRPRPARPHTDPLGFRSAPTRKGKPGSGQSWSPGGGRDPGEPKVSSRSPGLEGWTASRQTGAHGRSRQEADPRLQGRPRPLGNRKADGGAGIREDRLRPAPSPAYAPAPPSPPPRPNCPPPARGDSPPTALQPPRSCRRMLTLGGPTSRPRGVYCGIAPVF
ncbi:Collagen Alpha-5(Vi) Chain [Manis pentadactyla]|nr:Collagen Alpha-5(Vi) Chain [Manis pentadactyla]